MLHILVFGGGISFKCGDSHFNLSTREAALHRLTVCIVSVFSRLGDAAYLDFTLVTSILL